MTSAATTGRGPIAMLLAMTAPCVAGIEAPSPSDPAGWRHEAIDRALTSSEQIVDPYRRAEVETGVARAQALIDERNAAEKTLRTALKSAEDIVEPTFQGWVLNEIVLAQIAMDDLESARATAERIRSERPQGAAWLAIAMTQLRSDNLSGAMKTAMRIADDDAADQAWRQIVAVQVSRGDLKAARETVRRIDDDFYRAQAAGDIAVADVRAGELVSAKTMASSVRKAYRSQVSERIAIAQFDLGDKAGALVTASAIDSPIDRALVQARLATRMAAGADVEGANRLFAAATSVMSTAKDRDMRRATSWSHLARLKFAANDVTGAKQALASAISAAADMPAGPRRDDAYDAVARSYVRIGQSNDALEVASRIDDRVTQALLIRDIVASQAGSGGANALLQHPSAKGDSLTQTAALFGVIGVQLLRKDEIRTQPQIVGANIGTAKASVRAIPDVQIRPAAFAALAAAQATIGDIAAGQETFQEALQAAQSLGSAEQRATAYVRIVNALDERLLFLGQPAPADVAGAINES